ILVSDENEIQPSDLMLHGERAVAPWAERMTLAEAAERRPPAAFPASALSSFGPDDEDEDDAPPYPEGQRSGDIVSLEELKRQAVERAYRLCDGNVDKAAVELGIGRATMYRLLKKYKLMN